MSSPKESPKILTERGFETHLEYYDREIKCDYCHTTIGRFEVLLGGGDCYDCVVEEVDGLHEACYQLLKGQTKK
jgi:hypothetical protein